jgi:hypothetical protein
VRLSPVGVHSVTTRVGWGGKLSLRDLIRDEMAASRPRSERLAALRSARLYFQRPDEPGFLVSETEQGPVVPVGAGNYVTRTDLLVRICQTSGAASRSEAPCRSW